MHAVNNSTTHKISMYSNIIIAITLVFNFKIFQKVIKSFKIIQIHKSPTAVNLKLVWTFPFKTKYFLKKLMYYIFSLRRASFRKKLVFNNKPVV